jgi:hypothetical protein
MQFEMYGHRHGDIILAHRKEYRQLFFEICESLEAITDTQIILEYDVIERASKKSISQPINRLIKRELVSRGWTAESYIFADKYYQSDERGRASGIWRLDFAKGALAVEVAFNHRSDISWNLLKPTLSSELNHVPKAIQTEAGVVITATRDMKRAGGFDNAIGTFEDYVAYLKPMYHVLTVPLVIIGLEAPATFDIRERKVWRYG